MEASVGTDSRQYLVFKLGNEEYGLDIRKVTTIIEKNMIIARVPQTPDFIKGVINLRGEIIPVMDLRKRFDLPQVDDTEDTRIIIIKVEEIALGLIVDSVSEVIELSDDSIENIASFSNELSMDYVFGAAKLQNRIVTLINLDKLIILQDSNES
ncbi:MAG: chemotaxis protein CheW [Acetivibrionales bacterium]|jgi:purine-binding chemotaxis protein CheW